MNATLSACLHFPHNLNVEGILFSRLWVCRGWLLEPSFQHPGGTRNAVVADVIYLVPLSSYSAAAYFMKVDYHRRTIFQPNSASRLSLQQIWRKIQPIKVTHFCVPDEFSFMLSSNATLFMYSLKKIQPNHRTNTLFLVCLSACGRICLIAPRHDLATRSCAETVAMEWPIPCCDEAPLSPESLCYALPTPSNRRYKKEAITPPWGHGTIATRLNCVARNMNQIQKVPHVQK